MSSSMPTSILAIGPLGTAEMLIIGVILLFLAAVVGAVVFAVIALSKKKK